VLIQVQDDGVGIPHEMLERVFDMFGQVNQTLNRAQGGLGIGLALVRRLVELHGGTVKVESQGSNQGTTFTVTLPIDLVGTEQSPTAKSASDETQNCGQKVLVIDDNIDGAASLSIFLQMSGYATAVANSATIGLTLVEEFLPDIVLLDIGLPEMSGYEVARRIRAGTRGKDIYIVALTGWGADKDKEEAKAAGFNAHLTKPVDLNTLSELLKRSSDTLASMPAHLN
jgi:CheY-like chemotaxis protein